MTTCVNSCYELDILALRDALDACSPQQRALFAEHFGPLASIPICLYSRALQFIAGMRRKVPLENPLEGRYELFKLGTLVRHVEFGGTWIVAGYTQRHDVILVQSIVVSDLAMWKCVV